MQRQQIVMTLDDGTKIYSDMPLGYHVGESFTLPSGARLPIRRIEEILLIDPEPEEGFQS